MSDEPNVGEWGQMVAPIIAKFKLASSLGMNTGLTSEASAAAASLIHIMAVRLDEWGPIVAAAHHSGAAGSFAAEDEIIRLKTRIVALIQTLYLADDLIHWPDEEDLIYGKSYKETLRLYEEAMGRIT